jgi:hypothetical protein
MLIALAGTAGVAGFARVGRMRGRAGVAGFAGVAGVARIPGVRVAAHIASYLVRKERGKVSKVQVRKWD